VNASRAPAIVVLGALAIGVALFAADSVPRGVGVELPTAPSEVSTSGTAGDLWFCLGPTADLDGVAGRVVTLISHDPDDTEGRVTVADDTGRAVERTVRVAAGGHLDVWPGQSVPGATWAALTVEVPAGRVVVGDAITGSGPGGGVDSGPCTTATSASWQVPWATTSRPGNRAALLLYNPFRAPAVADLRFIGDIGRRETLGSQGVVVPGRSLSVFDLTERIADSAVVSATVDVRVGQLVVARLQVGDGTGPTGLRGLDLAYGSPRAAHRLFLPGVPSSSRTSQVVVLNPGDDYVEAEVVVLHADPETFVEPLRVVLRGRQRQVVDLDPGLFDRVGSYGLEVRSLDGQPLVASLIDRAAAGDQVVDGDDPLPPGLATRPATDVGATRWWFRLTADPTARWALDVANPATATIATVRFTVVEGQPSPGFPETVEIQPAGQARFVIPGDASATLHLEASVPVVVGLHRSGDDGRTWVDGVVIAGTAARPSS